MSQASSLLEEAHNKLARAASLLAEVLAASRSLWDADPLLEARALCIHKHKKTPCSQLTLMDLAPILYSEYTAALREAEEAGLGLEAWESQGFTIRWPPLEDLADTLGRLASLLSRRLGIPIEARAMLTPASNNPGHIGAKLVITTCTPSSWELGPLLYRLQLLLSELEGLGYPLSRIHLEGWEEAPPYRLGLHTYRCAGAVVAGVEERVEPGDDRAGDYIMVVDDELEQLYPVDPDSLEPHKPHKLYWYLPRYEPPWPCPEDLPEALRGLEYRVVEAYTRGALVRLPGGSPGPARLRRGPGRQHG